MWDTFWECGFRIYPTMINLVIIIFIMSFYICVCHQDKIRTNKSGMSSDLINFC